MTIHTDEHSHRNNGETWHSDVSADALPPMASILHIHKTPSAGGDTCWSVVANAPCTIHLSGPSRQVFNVCGL